MPVVAGRIVLFSVEWSESYCRPSGHPNGFCSSGLQVKRACHYVGVLCFLVKRSVSGAKPSAPMETRDQGILENLDLFFESYCSFGD